MPEQASRFRILNLPEVTTMENSSWLSEIFANPFLRGLAIGLFIAAVVYRLGMGSHMASTQATLRQA